MAGGGGSPDGRTQYDWNPTMGAYWQGTPENPGGFLGVANNEFWRNYGQGYQQYQGQRVADLSRNERRGVDEIYNMSLNPGAYSPDTAAGRQQNADTASGAYLGEGGNPFAGATNAYAGENPYYRSMVQQGMEDITQGYERGTAQQTNSLMNMSGVLGGGDHLKAVANNQAALGKSLTNYAMGMGNTQYDRSANLEQQRLGQASGAYENERGRMLQGAQQGLQGQGLSMDMFNQLIQSGGLDRGVQQGRNDVGWQNFQDQQNWGRNQLDWMGNFLGRAQGGIGGQVNMYGGGGNGLAQGLGTAMMGYGMFRS